MQASIENKIQNRKKRWIDFLSMDSEIKRLLITTIYKFEIENLAKLATVLIPGNKQKRIDYILEKYEKMLEQMQWLEDDSIPYLSFFTGSEIFAEAFGCKVKHPNSNLPFSIPIIKTSGEVTKLKVPNLYDSTLFKHFEIADEVIKRTGKDITTGLTDTPGPFEVAAQIWDKNEFFIALIKEPEAVKELTAKIMQLQIAFFDEWFSRYGNEFIAPFPNFYMKGGLYISNDEVGSINEQMFLDFVLDDLNTLSKRYGGLGMHCCANADHQWNNFKKIEDLHILNLVRPVDICLKAYKYFEDHCAQIHVFDNNIGTVFVEDPEKGTGALNKLSSIPFEIDYPENAHIVIMPTVLGKNEAIEASKKYYRLLFR